MAFDAIMRANPDERPFGSGEVFLTLMTAFTLTRAAVDGRHELGSLRPKQSGRLQLGLHVLSVGMMVAQTVGMVPVIRANSLNPYWFTAEFVGTSLVLWTLTPAERSPQTVDWNGN